MSWLIGVRVVPSQSSEINPIDTLCHVCLFVFIGEAPHIIPTNEEERQNLLAKETMATINEKRLQGMTSNFDDDSWLMAMSAGWEGGVHVQTCGHHLHHDCLRDYHSSLKTQQRQHNISIER